MFHSHEVNKEALFANWAYRTIHDAIVPYRHIIAGNSLSWRIQLPDAIKILCSTAEVDSKIVIEGDEYLAERMFSMFDNDKSAVIDMEDFLKTVEDLVLATEE